MPGHFEAVYTDDQREALATAYVDRAIRPARLVVDLAERGELADGLAPFKVSGGANTVRDMARKLRDRRAGRLASETAKAGPRDAVEALRIRLLSAIDHELTRVERQQSRRQGTKGENVEPELLRQLARALREAAAIPTRDEPTPPRPGHGPIGGPARKGGAIRPGPGTLGGRILADAESQTAHELPDTADAGSGDHAGSAGNHRLLDADTGLDEGAPGTWAREQIGALVGADTADT